MFYTNKKEKMQKNCQRIDYSNYEWCVESFQSSTNVITFNSSTQFHSLVSVS